jgi:hypothetical protein
MTKGKKAGKETKKPAKKESSGNDKILIISLIAIFVIFLGMLMVMKNSKDEPVKEETVDYKGYVFSKKGDLWYTELSVKDTVKGWNRQYNLYFHYNPDQVEDIPTVANSIGEASSPKVLIIGGRKIYITMDPAYPASVVLSGVEIAKVLGQVYELDVKAAVTTQSNKTDAPVITCADYGDGVRVVELRLAEETAIREEKGCIVVKGTNPQELLRAASRLAFELLKIM